VTLHCAPYHLFTDIIIPTKQKREKEWALFATTPQSSTCYRYFICSIATRLPARKSGVHIREEQERFLISKTSRLALAWAGTTLHLSPDKIIHVTLHCVPYHLFTDIIVQTKQKMKRMSSVFHYTTLFNLLPLFYMQYSNQTLCSLLFIHWYYHPNETKMRKRMSSVCHYSRIFNLLPLFYMQYSNKATG
jgi:hypothetical protein